MTIFEIINLNKELLRTFQNIGIRLNDVAYIELYNDYHKMVADGEKVSYIVAALATKHDISERKVYDLLNASKPTAICLQCNWL